MPSARSLASGRASRAVSVRSTGRSGAVRSRLPPASIVPGPAFAENRVRRSAPPSAARLASMDRRSMPCTKSRKLPPVSCTVPFTRGAATVPVDGGVQADAAARALPALGQQRIGRRQVRAPVARRSSAPAAVSGTSPVTVTRAVPAFARRSTCAASPCIVAVAVASAAGMARPGPVAARRPRGSDAERAGGPGQRAGQPGLGVQRAVERRRWGGQRRGGRGRGGGRWVGRRGVGRCRGGRRWRGRDEVGEGRQPHRQPGRQAAQPGGQVQRRGQPAVGLQHRLGQPEPQLLDRDAGGKADPGRCQQTDRRLPPLRGQAGKRDGPVGGVQRAGRLDLGRRAGQRGQRRGQPQRQGVQWSLRLDPRRAAHAAGGDGRPASGGRPGAGAPADRRAWRRAWRGQRWRCPAGRHRWP